MSLTNPERRIDGAPPEEKDEALRVTESIEQLFCRNDSPYPGYTLSGRPEILLRDKLSRADLLSRATGQRVEVTVFHKVAGLAGELWGQEMKTLYRLDALGHPGLPQVLGGAFDRDTEIAYTMTRRAGDPIEIGDVVRWAHRHPVQALEQFAVLLDALVQLHGARMLHRNLTLNALRYSIRRERRPGTVGLSLARFEMGAWLGNLIRRTSIPEANEAARREEFVRQVFLTPPVKTPLARHLPYLAPEHHPYVFRDSEGGRRDSTTTDLFGLGVFGWELFCGELPEQLPGEYRELEEALQGDGDQVVPALTRLHARMRAQLQQRKASGALPKPLAELLTDMIERSPTGRSSSTQLNLALDRNWSDVVKNWQRMDGNASARLVGYTRTSVGELVTHQWLAKTQAYDDPAIRRFFAGEFAEAQLTWSPSGAQFYPGTRCERPEEARWVLLGVQGVWFCQEHVWQGADHENPRATYAMVLTIQHVVPRGDAPGLARSRNRQAVGRIEAVHVTHGNRLDDELINRRPAWTDLQEPLQQDDPTDEELRDAELAQSLAFLLRYHSVMAESRIYAYERKNDDPTGTATLMWDEKRDRAWRHDDPLRSSYASFSDRPDLVEFCRQLFNQGTHLEVVGTVGDGRRPDFSNRDTVEVEIDRGLADTPGGDVVRVVPVGGRFIPPRGWLRPIDQAGSQVALRRQVSALAQLENRRSLLRSLHKPASVELNRDRWSGISDTLLPGAPAPQLDGNGLARVVDLLAYHPFYALQGPPGTGKTTVIVRAIRRLLHAEPGTRILVVAQANPAVNNLGSRLVKELPADTLVVRHTSVTALAKSEDDSIMRRHTLDRVTAALVGEICETLPQRIKKNRERLDPESVDRPKALASLAEQWLSRVRDSSLELTERVSRCASVVLTTCSAAATLDESDAAALSRFDWVVVEEAAKAWPTELMVPLVAGVRWALVGDHKQLGPHRARELHQFLASLSGRREGELVDIVKQAEAHRRAVELFAELFDGVPPEGRGPVQLLQGLFRMPLAVGEPFARTFYPVEPEVLDDGLPATYLHEGNDTVAAAAHGISSPADIVDRPIVWLDTGSRPDCVQEGSWRNGGEARIVTTLAEVLRPRVLEPSADQSANHGLVVLTPYRSQLALLENSPLLTGRVHTVHSFQGGEADRVIVSLVRSRRSAVGRRPPADPEKPMIREIAHAVGFLAEDEIVNVLLSRARRLLIVVGDFQLFRQLGGPSWKKVTRIFEHRDAVVQAHKAPWL